jgi:TPR repeat protein
MKSKVLSIILLCFVANMVRAAGGPSPSPETMFKQLATLASTDNADVKYNLGMFYNNGIGTPRDNQAAFRYFLDAAEAGNLLAAYKVGCYYAGQFPGVVPIDLQTSIKYKLRSAEGGYDLAQHDVGLYFSKEGKLPEALLWWEKASRQGHGPSTAYLAYYFSGTDSKNEVKGFALMLVLKEQMRTTSKELAEKLASAEATLSIDEKMQAERIKATWLIAPTSLTIAGRAGISVVPALLESFGSK